MDTKKLRSILAEEKLARGPDYDKAHKAIRDAIYKTLKVEQSEENDDLIAEVLGDRKMKRLLDDLYEVGGGDKMASKREPKMAGWMSELHLLLTDAQEARGRKPLTVDFVKKFIGTPKDELERRALKWLDNSSDEELLGFLRG